MDDSTEASKVPHGEPVSGWRSIQWWPAFAGLSFAIYLAVDGEDLQREGIARGPALGKILRSLLEWVVEEPTRNDRDSLLVKAR